MSSRVGDIVREKRKPRKVDLTNVPPPSRRLEKPLSSLVGHFVPLLVSLMSHVTGDRPQKQLENRDCPQSEGTWHGFCLHYGNAHGGREKVER